MGAADLAPKGAPNVLLIMTDDQGYGVSGTFGGVIPTPDARPPGGERAALYRSSIRPRSARRSRAALITGRNHHSGGFGVITELSTGFPGLSIRSSVPKTRRSVRILKDNGYATSWFGKDHNTPDFEYSVAGPFDQWPSGMGFDYFYGFMGGETDQWTPYLFENNRQVFPWVGKEGKYNLTTEHGDKAIDYCRVGRGRTEFALVPLLRPGRHALAAQSDAALDRQVQGQVRHGLECHARSDLCQPEAARRHSGKHQLTALA